MSEYGDRGSTGDPYQPDPARNRDLGTRPYPTVPSGGPAGPSRGDASPRRIIDAKRLWTGGVMAAVVAAGVAIVGLLIARGILDIPVLIPHKGKLADPSTWWYAAVSFLAALAATGLLHLLLAAAPAPYSFFGWIFGLAVAIAVLTPFTTSAGLSTKVAVAVINLAIGVTIGSIVSRIGRSSSRILDEPLSY